MKANLRLEKTKSAIMMLDVVLGTEIPELIWFEILAYLSDCEIQNLLN